MVRSHRFAINPQEDSIDIENKVITIRRLNLIHQISKVLRLNSDSKETLEFIDGISPQVYQASISSNIIGKSLPQSINLNIDAIQESNRELSTHVRFFVPIIKIENLEIMIRKLTELGVKEFIPVVFERSQKKYLRKLKQTSEIERIQKIIESATEQCEGSILAKFHNFIHFDDISEYIEEDGSLNIFASEWLAFSNCKKQSQEQINKALDSKIINLLVGPEGGLSQNEVNKLMSSGFEPTSLGIRILKAETAAITLFSRLLIN